MNLGPAFMSIITDSVEALAGFALYLLPHHPW